MKKLVYLLIMLVGFACIYSSHAANVLSEKTIVQTSPRLFVGITTRSSHFDDSCGGDRGFCILVIWNRVNNIILKEPNSAIAEMSLGKDGRLKLDILSDNSKDGKEYDPLFRIFRDIELPEELANALGRDGLTILKGEYVVDLGKSKYGSILLKTK